MNKWDQWHEYRIAPMITSTHCSETQNLSRVVAGNTRHHFPTSTFQVFKRHRIKCPSIPTFSTQQLWITIVHPIKIFRVVVAATARRPPFRDPLTTRDPKFSARAIHHKSATNEAVSRSSIALLGSGLAVYVSTIRRAFDQSKFFDFFV